MEGIWSGLSLQKLCDQLLECQAYDWHSALDGKQIQRKKCPFWSVHANVSHCFSRSLQFCLWHARNTWVLYFCQFLWVVRWLNVWLLHCMVGIMLGKENYIKSTRIWSLNSKHRKVTKATVGNLNMKGQMGKDSFNRLRLGYTGSHSCCYDK